MRLREDTETAAGAALKIYVPKDADRAGRAYLSRFWRRQGRYAESDRRRYGRGVRNIRSREGIERIPGGRHKTNGFQKSSVFV